ncbi:unnamed protein product [Phaedon cochleariae]|uniref:DBF4-type domain-containing protein n=1 Tax=Phaedon cochleariae TaxID=80249 RepID=A0A9N9SGE8_PHACE|nr:unnamed protein product [Phaedon cochleariae]
MLERTTRSYFDNILSKDFTRLQENDITELDTKKPSRQRSPRAKPRRSDEVETQPPVDDMTRRTRTRRPRIPALQSGYCAVCNVPYNSVQDHIQSKKHQKLIGEDANYIALNGSLNGFLQNDSIPFLNLNGVDAIGVHDSSFDEFSPKYKKRAMPRTRACSVMSDRVKCAPLSPGSDITGHRLRSRKNINYMSPPSDDDSMQEKPDLILPEEPAAHEYKEYRELRSSTKALAKLTEQVTPSTDQEVWNSGRPKRACINKKRHSTEDYVIPNTKTFYKVEVLSPKPPPKPARRPQSQSPKREEEKEKALIVKFKKMRSSELVRLNNEATNFLFPQKDDSDSESEGEEQNPSDCGGSSPRLSCSDEGEEGEGKEFSGSFKVDDDRSMDSTSSSTKGKRKRRTHAEAFIMDNEKYYKFETPGSRLRYHGSYLPAVPKSPKFNGMVSPKSEDVKPDEPKEKKIRYNPDAKVQLDNYKFSFEKVPREAPWYAAFRRIDRGEQTYIEFSDYFFDPFLLPYQMSTIPPLDPRVCLAHYGELRRRLCDMTTDPPPQPGKSETNSRSSKTNSRSSTPDASVADSMQSSYLPDPDEDSKLSILTASSRSDVEEENPEENQPKSGPPGPGKNPRKSPRQHASTLAILSSLIQQRRKRAKNKLDKSAKSLAAIPEEEKPPEVAPEPEMAAPEPEMAAPPKTPARKTKPRVDYHAIALQIDKELDSALDDSLENYDLDIAEEQTVDFLHSKTSLEEILRLYEEDKSKESEWSCRRFLNGAPGRKPGRRKKTNKTGWPNKNNRKSTKRDASKEKDENTDSEDSEEDVCEEEVTDCAKEDSDNADKDCDRVDKNGGKVLMNKETNSEVQFQPYVCVQKLDGQDVRKEVDNSTKRTKRKLRHMPGSPKSPRMLRKPRGRWYRER